MATINGTKGNEVIIGTSGDDTITGGGGKDVINLRGKLLWEPTSRLSILAQAEYLRDRSQTVPSVNENYLYTGPGG